MRVDLTKLRRLAEQATPGEREVIEDGVIGFDLTVPESRTCIAMRMGGKDAAFAAACSPEVVIALLDAIADLEQLQARGRKRLEGEHGTE